MRSYPQRDLSGSAAAERYPLGRQIRRMMQFIRLVAIGAIVVLLFDAIASIASNQLGFPYTSAAWGSYLIYGATGYFVGRQFDVPRAALAGAALGFVDATLGWAASTALQANAPPTPELNPAMWVTIAITVMITGAICASIGGAIARALRKSPSSAA